MFNTTRPTEEPAILSQGEYNHPEVVNALKPMFYGKCYLCERGDIQDVEVEHFVPHKGNKTLKFDWQNLFYSCSRCNSLKSSKHVDLLDCTKSDVDVFRAIVLKMPTAPDDDIAVTASSARPAVEVRNTVKLLDECYNKTNTALREVSRTALIEQMYEYLLAFMRARSLLRNPSVGPTKKTEAKEVIQVMLDVKHPFSAFWRWQYLSDSFLKEQYPELESGF